MPPDTLGAYAVAVAALSSIFVQGLKVIFIDPRWPDGAQRNVTVWFLNYFMNLALLLVVVITHGAWNAADLFNYLALAAGQSVGSHVNFKTMQSSGKSAPDPAGVGASNVVA